MDISVVIPTRERVAVLRRTLAALSSQSLSKSDFEIIVVENGVTESVRTLMRDFENLFPHFRFLHEDRPGQALARNRGIRATSGELVVFVDDDVIPDSHFLAEHLRAHRQYPDAAVLGYVRFPWSGLESPLHWVLAHRPEYLNSYHFRDPHNIPFVHFYTCNSAVPRSLFSSMGVFDEALSGYGFEDSEFAYRLVRSGHRIVFAPRASALHDHYAAFTPFEDKRHQAGRALRYVLRKHPELHATLVPSEHAFRRHLTTWIGSWVGPLAGLFDRRVPAWILPLLGRLCQYRLEYRFWAEFHNATT